MGQLSGGIGAWACRRGLQILLLLFLFLFLDLDRRTKIETEGRNHKGHRIGVSAYRCVGAEVARHETYAIVVPDSSRIRAKVNVSSAKITKI